MTAAARLVTYVDVVERSSRREQILVSARLELEVADGRRVVLLDDRGWGSSGKWAETSSKEIQDTARMVVGPDEPPEGCSREAMESLYWDSVQQAAQRKGLDIDVSELRCLPHDVVLSERLLARIGVESE